MKWKIPVDREERERCLFAWWPRDIRGTLDDGTPHAVRVWLEKYIVHEMYEASWDYWRTVRTTVLSTTPARPSGGGKADG